MKYTKLFSFISMNLPATTFKVVNFTGEEALSRPYFFNILLASSEGGLFMEDVSDGNAKLTFLYKDMELAYQGLVFRFEQLRGVDGHFYYKALLAPRLWALNINRASQVFLDKTVPEIFEEILLSSGLLSGLDVEFRLSATYPKREYVCQYNESYFEFFSRWCEREGIYYFFEQEEHGEKLVVTDTLISHVSLPRQPKLLFHEISGLDYSVENAVATSFTCEQTLIPKAVELRDYNYRHSNFELDSGDTAVDQGDIGKIYFYGDNLRSLDEAAHLAKVRAEEFKAGQKIFKGEAWAPFLRSGFTFSLTHHPVPAFNGDYLSIAVHHKGNQSGYLASGLGLSLAGQEEESVYQATVTAIPAKVQYRPPRKTPLPRFHGVINATIESGESGEYAYLDEQGRYKVRLPFDLAGHPEGKASSWLRMAQPYSGRGHGMHFPLLKGTEVLLTFVDGDLDKPLIAAAVPNVEHESLVNNTNAASNALRSASGNQMVMGDKKGQEFIGLFSPHAQSGIAIGSHKPGGGGSIAISTKGVLDELALGGRVAMTVGSSNEFVVGMSNDFVAGMTTEVKAAVATEAALMSKIAYTRGQQIELGSEAMDLKDTITVIGLNHVEISGGIGQTVDGLVKKAKKALWLGIAASAAAGFGAAAISRPFDKDFLQNSSIEWGKAPSTVGGGLAVVLGLALAAYSVKTIKSVAESYEEASENEKTGNIILDENGIAAKVNSKVNDTATLLLEVDEKGMTSGGNEKSSIEILAKGQKIMLKNKGSATLGMENGNLAYMITADDNGKTSGFQVDDAKVYIRKYHGGVITLDTSSGIFSFSKGRNRAATPGSFTTKVDEAKVACGRSNSLSVKNDAVTISATKGDFTASGALTLNGSTITIG